MKLVAAALLATATMTGLPLADEMGANPVTETQVAAAATSLKPYEALWYAPKDDYSLFNLRFGVICQWPTDIENAQQLLDSGRPELVEQIGGCYVFKNTVEFEQIEKFGSTLKVRWITPRAR